MPHITIKSKTYGVHKCYFDESDRGVVNSHTWCIVPNRKTFYAMSRLVLGYKKYKTVRMHQLFLLGSKVDHKNGNGLDNRRNNLRMATTQQNNFNVGLTKRNKTGYKGVCTRSANTLRPYIASIRISGKLIIGGSFSNPLDAAKKYNELAKKYHGEFAWLNPV